MTPNVTSSIRPFAWTPLRYLPAWVDCPDDVAKWDISRCMDTRRLFSYDPTPSSSARNMRDLNQIATVIEDFYLRVGVHQRDYAEPLIYPPPGDCASNYPRIHPTLPLYLPPEEVEASLLENVCKLGDFLSDEDKLKTEILRLIVRFAPLENYPGVDSALPDTLENWKLVIREARCDVSFYEKLKSAIQEEKLDELEGQPPSGHTLWDLDVWAVWRAAVEEAIEPALSKDWHPLTYMLIELAFADGARSLTGLQGFLADAYQSLFEEYAEYTRTFLGGPRKLISGSRVYLYWEKARLYAGHNPVEMRTCAVESCRNVIYGSRRQTCSDACRKRKSRASKREN